MRIYLDTIGCRLNQAEIEQYARQFRAVGHELVPTPDQAELALVNTCAVTAAAASDSRQKIRQLARAGVDNIAVTGCWSTLQPLDAAALPGVMHVVSNLEKEHLVADLLNLSPEIFDLEPVDRTPIPGARLRTRAFIKVQDGCDNRCTFCVTSIARGPGRSRSEAEILADIRAALNGSKGHESSAQEIVLTGVHLGSWGQDFVAPKRLSDLIRMIISETDVPRLRLSSLEPWDLDDRFFELWQDRRLCRHIHLPLQSGSAATLRRMARKTTPQSFADLVSAARLAIPQVAITTDIITGFPGESNSEFEESLAFARAMQFANGHIFTYSARPGTAAARMPNQVPEALRKERNARMRAVLADSAKRYQSAFVGQVLPVLWESATGIGPSGWQMSGLTDNYLRVHAQASQDLWNQVTPVRLAQMAGEEMLGHLL